MSTRRPPIRPTSWPLLSVPDDDGQLAFPSPEQSVRQMIQVILRTRPGEQLMRPEFGGGLEQFLHQPNTLDTRRQIRERVASSIVRWEPRLLLDSVEVDEVPGRPAHVRVEVAYRMRRTGAAQKVGLTMEVAG